MKKGSKKGEKKSEFGYRTPGLNDIRSFTHPIFFPPFIFKFNFLPFFYSQTNHQLDHKDQEKNPWGLKFA